MLDPFEKVNGQWYPFRSFASVDNWLKYPFFWSKECHAPAGLNPIDAFGMANIAPCTKVTQALDVGDDNRINNQVTIFKQGACL